jgi:hypothetical protein
MEWSYCGISHVRTELGNGVNMVVVMLGLS